MKIVCAWCQADLGEKCPECSSTNVSETVLSRDAARILGFATRSCGDCGLVFVQGEGGVSSTVCGNCRKEKFPNLPARLTADEIVERAK